MTLFWRNLVQRWREWRTSRADYTPTEARRMIEQGSVRT